MALKVSALCVAAAMICSALRIQRPEIATAVSLASGLAVLAMVCVELGRPPLWVESILQMMRSDGDVTTAVVKGAGIALVCELGSQLCSDAGESALAGRIMLASRVAMLGLCAPMLSEMARMIAGALS